VSEWIFVVVVVVLDHRPVTVRGRRRVTTRFFVT
jgi:hypothetical protein